MTTRPPLLLLSLALVVASASAQAPTAPDDDAQHLEQIFSRFDHRMHARPLQREGIGCTGCHQVGGTGDARLTPKKADAAFLPPPPGACHYCHNPPVEERDIGPGRCALCHDVVDPPTSHGAGWIDLHGSEMRVGALQCEDCHRQAFCIDCHDRQERSTYQVHDRSWMAVHGIAAKTDPGACGTCHVQEQCTDCHAGHTWGGP